jgi:predicted nucleic-acid-binding protein
VIAIDTNVLVRILVDEPSQPSQVIAARALASDAGKVFVPLVVLVEMVWVLESAYGLCKTDVEGAVEHLLANSAFSLDQETLCGAALRLFRESGADFSDCLILADCQARELPLHTFDKRLAQLSGGCLVF